MSVSGSVSSAHADAVLDRLGRMGLVEALARRTRESRVVPQPVVRLYFAQPSSRRAARRTRSCGARAGGARARPPARCRRAPSTRSGCSAARISRPQRAARQATRTACSVPVASITRSRRAANSSGCRPSAPAGRSERPLPRPSNVTHAAVAGEVWDLRLPEARVDDRPGRHQEDRRLAVPVDLVEHAHAVALDVPLFVGVAGTVCSGAGAECLARRAARPVLVWIAISLPSFTRSLFLPFSQRGDPSGSPRCRSMPLRLEFVEHRERVLDG